MPAYYKKTKTEILSEALEKLTDNTPITAVGPGSIARSLVEAVTGEIGDLYDILDFNITQSYLSTATGAALDGIGALYGVTRKQVSELARIEKETGSFYFYIQSPYTSDITIPSGTSVFTSATSFVGRQHTFSTTQDVIIPAGRTRAYAPLSPNFVDAVYSAGVNTLVHSDLTGTPVTVFCTNPKGISPLPGYETDEDYRIRIIKKIRVTAAGTIEAVRFAGLGAPNVREVKIRQAPYGMGSFEAVVVAERGENVGQTVNTARAAMEEVKPVGSRMFTVTPTLLSADVTIDIFIPGASNSTTTESIKSRVEIAIRRYLQSFLPGNKLVYNRLIQAAMSAHDTVRDVNISSLSINGAPQLNKNFQSKDDEQITSGSIVVNIGSS